MNVVDFVLMARSYAGCNAGDHRDRYVALLMKRDDPSHMAQYYANPRTSGCALVTLGLWYKGGVVHPRLTDPYELGHAVVDMVSIAKDLDAYHDFDDITRGGYAPKPGDAVIITGHAEHAFTIVAIEQTPGGWEVASVDGGQVIKGQQGIKLKSRVWTLRGIGILDAPPRERGRDVACIIDTAKMLSAAVDGVIASEDISEPPPAPDTDPSPHSEPLPFTLGVDVSIWQKPGEIDWHEVARTYSFAIARATYGPTKDSHFIEHISNARAAGMLVGAYHFLWQDADADAQLHAFREQLIAADIGPGDIVPAIDLEDDGERDFDIYVPRAREFIYKLGMVMVYSGPDFIARMGSPEWLREYPLWIAHYTDRSAPAAPWPWSIWQHTGTGRINGYAKDIDLNRARTVPIIGAPALDPAGRDPSGTGYY